MIGDRYLTSAAMYEANASRRSSPETDFGVRWHDADGAICRVSLIESTGEVYAVRVGPAWLLRHARPMAGCEIIGELKVEWPLQKSTVLRLLAGWTGQMERENSLAWVIERLSAERDG